MTLAAEHDPVDHPQHYTAAVPGIECIDVTEHFPFCRGNAIKYLWRAGAKGDLVEDLRKAIWYIEREIAAAQKDPHKEGGVSEGAPRSGVRGATQAQRSTAGGDSLKVAPDAPETAPAAEEGTSGVPAAPASTSCSQCGQRTPTCLDCGDPIIFMPKAGFGNTGEWQHKAPRLMTVAPHLPRPKVFIDPPLRDRLQGPPPSMVQPS